MTVGPRNGLTALLIVAAALASTWVPATAQPAPEKKPAAPAVDKKASPLPWKKVPDSQRQVLTPLEKDWDQLPSVQQRRLVDSARQYPKLAPIQQERFQERIKDWAALTPDQRKAARDKYRDLSTLPPAKQHELRQKWSEKSQRTDVPPPSTPPAGNSANSR